MNKKYINIINLILEKQGVDVSKYDDVFLDKAIQRRIEETISYSSEEYYSLLEKNKKERTNFLDSLHICYSEFFRNPLTFAVLENIILPSLILDKNKSKRKNIRVWSAACAAGQEAYSVAMLFEELINDISEKSAYRIFVTDQCEDQLNKAVIGQYDDSELNNLTLKRVKQWLIKQGNVYAVKPELKKNIDFSVFDLFDEKLSSPAASIFGDFDIVFCSNLLFYYKPEFRKMILAKVGNSLKEGGYIIVGESERDILFDYNYKEVFPHSAIFMKR
jgi:chemotaxis methyl-accepting protein methylase